MMVLPILFCPIQRQILHVLFLRIDHNLHDINMTYCKEHYMEYNPIQMVYHVRLMRMRLLV